MKIKNLAILTILSVTLFTGCGDKDKIDENIVADTETKAKELPIFNLTTSTGKSIKIVTGSDGWKFVGLEGKVVLLDFFGTWCPPCKAEIPHLLNIRKKLKADFEILGIDVGPRGGGTTSPEELAEFIKEFKVTYPITTGGDNGKLFGAVKELNPNGSIPFMLLFNKQGQYVQYYIGMKPEEMLFNDISSTIKMK